MRDKALGYLGLMRKSNSIELGETNTGITVRDGKAKLLILAADASDNARSRAEGFVRGRNVTTVTVPFSKEEISDRVGVNGCSMAAVTDIGFANAFMKALCAFDPQTYKPLADEVSMRYEKAEQRKREAQAHKSSVKGKRRSNV